MPNRRARRTRAEIQVAKTFGGKRRRRKVLPRQIYPRGIQLAYARRLIAIVRESRKALEPLLAALPSLVASAAADRDRLDAGEGRKVSDLIEEARRGLQGAVSQPALSKLAADFAAQTETWQRKQMLKQSRAALGVDIFANDAGLGYA